MKKIISILLAVSMLCSISVTAFAADPISDSVLRFNKNGKFKILVLADVQDDYPMDPSTIAFIEEALDYAKPDLVVFDGDNVMTTDLRAYDQMLNPLVERGVKFSLVFGNHDPEVSSEFPTEEQLKIYQSYEGCLAYDAVPELSGVGNHNLPILSSKGNDIAFNLWFFDSGTAYRDSSGEWLGYEWVKEDQINWYKQTSDALTLLNGGEKVYSISFQHIIPKECVEVLFHESPVELGELTYNNVGTDGKTYSFVPKIDSFDGYIFEKCCPGYSTDGQWQAFIDQGDMLACVVGHDHVNSFVADINGVDIVQVPGATNESYYNNLNQGSRIIELDEGDLDSYYTYELTANELASKSGSDIPNADGDRSESSYTIASILRPVLDMIMMLLRDTLANFTKSIQVPTVQ